MDEATKERNALKAINEAICYWLGYQFKIGRDKLIHEASLRYPIADTITANGIEINKINLEKGHPFFEDRIADIFIYNEDVSQIKKGDLTSIVSIFELKIAKKDTGAKFGQENQRIVDDILRLAYFNLKTTKTAYFLICGTYQDFKNYFIGQGEPVPVLQETLTVKELTSESSKAKINWDKGNSLYKDYFDFEIHSPPQVKEYTFIKRDILESDTDDIKEEKEFGLHSFKRRYKPKNSLELKDKIKIKTTCVALTPFETTTHRTHACGIWKIEGEIPA